MLDIREIGRDPEGWRARLCRRGDVPGLDEVLALDERRRALIQEVDGLRNKRTVTSKGMAGVADKKSAEFAALRDEMRAVGDRIKAIEAEQKEVQEALYAKALVLPNVPEEGAPDGTSEADNPVVRTWGKPTRFEFEPKAHWDLAEPKGWLDFEAGAKVAKTRFPVYRGALARLERALWNLMLDLHTTEHGYTEILPPFLVAEHSMVGTGQFPKFREDAFTVDGGELVLVPTAEVPLTNLHREEILEADTLPRRYTAFTPCFRKEAGGYGRDTRGLIRVHQFQKVEMVHITTPEDSEASLQAMVGHAAAVLEKLELPFRIVDLCTGDLGFGAKRTFDLEVWLPGQGEYREISSCSNCGDFQARRAMIRYRPEPGAKPRLCHTLNGSGLAVGRTVVAVLENYQREDGSVAVPKALQGYMGGLTELR